MKKTSAGEFVFTALAIAVPLLYHLMYLPVWGGKELVNYGPITGLLLLFEGISFLLAVAHLLLLSAGRKCRTFTAVFTVSALLSFLWFCFVALVFTLELLGVEWFPAQR